MSIPPDQMPPPEAPPQQGSILTRKVAGLPGWAWAGVALVGGYLLYRHFTSSSSSTSTGMATGTTGTATGSGYTDLQPIILDQQTPAMPGNPGGQGPIPPTNTIRGSGGQVWQKVSNPTLLHSLYTDGYTIHTAGGKNWKPGMPITNLYYLPSQGGPGQSKLTPHKAA